MKFQANWFLEGKEVELPDMKIEGSLAVAELMKKHVDDFLPFVLTMQEEATLRLRVSVLTEVITAGKEATAEQKAKLKTLFRIYEKPVNDETLIEEAVTLLPEVMSELEKKSKEVARVQIISAPFFLERSLLEAYYMMKAYVFESAREKSRTPNMPFKLDDLKSLISDAELAIFAKNSMQKMKENAGDVEPTLETPNEEDIKKKYLPGQGTSGN
jgi:hypothetical protein